MTAREYLWRAAPALRDRVRAAIGRLTIETWRRLSPAERAAVEDEAALLPLPGLRGSIEVVWG